MTHVTVEYSLMNIVTDGNFIGSNDVKPVLMSWSGGKDLSKGSSAVISEHKRGGQAVER